MDSFSIATFSISEERMCELFQEFMRKNGLSERSVKKYSSTVPNNKGVCFAVKTITGKSSLFRVTSLDELEKILTEVLRFNYNKKGHNMYSAGISQYKKFLTTLHK